MNKGHFNEFMLDVFAKFAETKTNNELITNLISTVHGLFKERGVKPISH